MSRLLGLLMAVSLILATACAGEDPVEDTDVGEEEETATAADDAEEETDVDDAEADATDEATAAPAEDETAEEEGEDAAPDVADDTEEPSLATVEVAYAAQAQLPFVPSLTAWERLESEHGYRDIRARHLPGTDLSLQATLQGLTHASENSTSGHMQAVAAGAEELVGVGIMFESFWVLVSRADITTPEELVGTTVGVHGEATNSMSVMQHTIEQHGLQDVNIVIIPSSGARREAMLAGELDATPMFLDDAILLEEQAPGEFNILADYTELPLSGAMSVQRSFIDDHPDVLHDMLREMILVHREFAENPDVAALSAQVHLPDADPDFVDRMAREYVERGFWPTYEENAPTYDDVAEWIAFFKDLGELPADAPDDPEAYFDLGPLEAVLEELDG